MRIFTLGKNGITLFYFAFILFSGTYSYGQQVDSCGVTDQNTEAAGNQQYFCDSDEAELNNLLVDGTNISFFEDPNYSDELDATDLLVGGRTYYIEVDGCQSSVTVTIFNQPQILGVEEDALTRRPEANTKQSLGTIELCVADVDDPNVFVSDLRTNAPAETIRWYRSATSTGTPQLISASEELQNNTYYYAERVYNDPVDSELNCTTNRARTLVLLTAEAAPEADAEQEFCASDAPTVGDIVASGDNRYYTNATSEVEISQNALLEDGRTYYVSTLGQSCESELRTPVTVTVQPSIEVEDQIGEVCSADVSETFPDEDAIEGFYLALLEGQNVPENGTFTPSIDQIATQYQNDDDGLGDFTTTYTFGDGQCEASVDLTIRVTESRDANAGEIEDITLECDAQEIIILDDSILSENATTGGTFSGEGVNADGNFDPSVGPGEYIITYSVDDSAECVVEGTEDSETFTITVGGIPDLGEEIAMTMCVSEVIALLDQPQDAVNLFTNILQERGLEGDQLNGTFDPNELIVGAQIYAYVTDPTTPSQTFETTYTVSDECGTESVDISLTINEGDAFAGNPNTGIVCTTEVRTVLHNNQAVEDFFLSLLDEGVSQEGTFAPSIQEVIDQYQDGGRRPGDYSTIYTVGEGACEASVELTISITDVQDAEAGTIADITVDCASEEVVVLDENILSEDAIPGGTFSGEGINEAGNFDPALVGPGEYEITYFVDEETGCVAPGTEDQTTFTITVEGLPDLGDEVTITMCISEVLALLDQPQDAVNLFTNILQERGLEGDQLDGNFDPALEVVGLQILSYINNPTTPSQTFPTNYTVSDECGTESVDIALTINDTVEGTNEIDDFTVCSGEGTINLFNRITEANAQGGTFYTQAGEEITDGMFSTAQEGEFTITYTVSEDDEGACVEGTVSTEFVVTVNEGDAFAGTPSTGFVCTTEVRTVLHNNQAVEDFFLSLLDEGVSQEGTFDPSIQEVIDQYQDGGRRPGDYSTIYTVVDGNCEASVELTITITEEEDAYAGTIADRTVCSTDSLIDLSAYLSDEATLGGTFTGTGVDENGMFNPATGVDVYTITYFVDDSADCVTPGTEDSTTFEIEVLQGADLGEDIAETLCETDLADDFDADDFTAYYVGLLGNLPNNGTFSPSLASLYDDYTDQSTGTFTTTYTVGSEACEDSVQISLTINEEEDAEAGEFDELTFCTTSGSENLNDYLGDEATQGGTFSVNGEVLENGIFDAAMMGEGSYQVTYSVNESIDCVQGEDSVTFVVDVIEGPEAGEDAFVELCAAQVDNFIANPADAIAFLSDLIDENADQTGTFEPSLSSIIAQWTSNPLGTFTSTYTVGNDECEDSAEITIVVTEEGPGLGEDQVGIVCETDVQTTFYENDAVRDYYLNLLPEGVSQDGTFEPSIQGIVDEYQADSDGLGDFITTYTVDNGECVASVDLTIRIIEAEEAITGDIADVTVCSVGESINLFAQLSDDNTPGGIFFNEAGDEITNGVFDIAEEGEFTITYTVSEDDEETCLTGTASTSFTVTVFDGDVNAGEDVTLTYCVTEIEGIIESEEEAANWFASLIDAEADTDGTFNPTLETLATQYMANPTGTFETTYTVTNGDCEDSADLFVTINEEEDANAGTIADQTVCSTDGLIDLSTYLSDEATLNGTFTGTGVDENGMFNPATGVDVYTVTYFVDDSADCVTPGTEDSTTFEIEVLQGPDAGSDNSADVCNAEIQAGLFDGDVDLLRAFYLDLLDEGVSREGTFTTNLQDLIDRYDSGDEIGAFTAIYTISNGNCENSVELTLNIIEGEAPNAGEDMDLAFCATEGAQDLFEYLAGDVNTTGSFEGLEDGVFDPAEMEVGEYTYEYTVTTTGECGGTDTATITVTLSDSPEAPEVADAVFCVSEGATVATIDAGENFNWYTTADLGTPAPADEVLVEGRYFVTQTNEGGCESEATEVTVTLEDTPAPTLTQGGNVFCETENPTIADLMENINGTGTIAVYDAETGGEVYNSADRLVSGTTYYVSLTDTTSGCESSQRLAVPVEFDCPFVLPEAFSPNGDQINDTFDLENLSPDYPNFGIEIYNRWGNKVFTGNSTNSQWDGTSDDGSLGDGVLPAGVYFYILNYNDGQTAPIQGRVYLSR